VTQSRRALNVADLREAARRSLPRALFEFIDRGTEDEVALRENRLAFERIRLRPRVGVDVSIRSQAVSLFGREQAMPLAVAPTGIAPLAWFDGEVAVARAAAAAGIPFAIATASLTAMERLAAEAGGRLWFQLYAFTDARITVGLIERARAAGFEALIVTLDTPVFPNREYNLRNGFAVPVRMSPRLALDVLGHPGWLMSVLLRYRLRGGLPVSANLPEPYRRLIARDPDAVAASRSAALTWEDVRAIRDRWPGIFMVKGIMRSDDARRAVVCGADAIIVSNHGGRTLDSALAPIDALPGIADCVGDAATVLMDGGVRRGSDVVKALARGARAVLVGRAPLYGVAAGGQAGAAHALALLRREIDLCLALAGCPRAAEISAELLADCRRAVSCPEFSNRKQAGGDAWRTPRG